MGQPLTLRYGSWSPDLANVPQEIPYINYAPVDIASVDCSGVYFADGSFRCLPSPAPIAPALSAQALNALTWYDTVQGQEVVFAGTANGIYELVDGVWTLIQPLVSISVALTGQAMSVRLAGFIKLLGQAMAFSQGSVGYIGQFLAAIMRPASGEYFGFIAASQGSLTPSKDVNGNTVIALYCADQNPRTGLFPATLKIGTASLGADYFLALIIGPSTYLAADMGYSTGSGYSQWTFNVDAAFTNSSYSVVITPPPTWKS